MLVAVLFKDSEICAIRVGRIEVDGTDAARTLMSMLKNLRFKAVLLSSISFAGFNLIDIGKLARRTRKPVIAITGKKPENWAVKRALRTHFADWRERVRIVNAAGRIYRFKPIAGEPEVYFEVKGAKPALARHLIRSYALISRLPEPVRVAGILAKGLSQIKRSDLSLSKVDRVNLKGPQINNS